MRAMHDESAVKGFHLLRSRKTRDIFSNLLVNLAPRGRSSRRRWRLGVRYPKSQTVSVNITTHRTGKEQHSTIPPWRDNQNTKLRNAKYKTPPGWRCQRHWEATTRLLARAQNTKTSTYLSPVFIICLFAGLSIAAAATNSLCAQPVSGKGRGNCKHKKKTSVVQSVVKVATVKHLPGRKAHKQTRSRLCFECGYKRIIFLFGFWTFFPSCRKIRCFRVYTTRPLQNQDLMLKIHS